MCVCVHACVCVGGACIPACMCTPCSSRIGYMKKPMGLHRGINRNVIASPIRSKSHASSSRCVVVLAYNTPPGDVSQLKFSTHCFPFGVDTCTSSHNARCTQCSQAADLVATTVYIVHWSSRLRGDIYTCTQGDTGCNEVSDT